MVWNRRLRLFWFHIEEKADPLNVTFTTAGLGGTTPARFFEIRLAWSERAHDGWTPRRLSVDALPAQYVNPPYFYSPDQLTFGTRIDEHNQLLVQSTQVPYGFLFDGCHTEPQIREGVLDLDLALTGTALRGQQLTEEWGDDMLYLPIPKDTPALRHTLGFFRLMPQTNGANLEDNPIAYRDGEYSDRGPRSFLITPHDVSIPFWQWPDLDTVDPGLTAVVPELYWEEVVVVPDPIGPIIDPSDPPIFDPLYAVGPSAGVATAQRGGAGPGGGLRFGVMPVVRAQPFRAGTEMNGGGQARLAMAAGPVAAPALLFAPGSSPASWAAATLAETVTSGGTLIGERIEKRYRFQPLYHPWVCAFVRELNRNGVDGLLQRRVQLHPEEFAPRVPGAGAPTPLDFPGEYGPQQFERPIVVEPYPVEDVDFEEDGAYAIYNWELFFFAPLLIADMLSRNQRYEEAQRWFETVFDPTDTSGRRRQAATGVHGRSISDPRGLPARAAQSPQAPGRRRRAGDAGTAHRPGAPRSQPIRDLGRDAGDAIRSTPTWSRGCGPPPIRRPSS